MTYTNEITTKTARNLKVGDVVLGLGGVTFDEPHTVTNVTAAAVFATGGCFWPLPIVGNAVATVAA